MSQAIRGVKPRPRVVLLGEWRRDERQSLENLFPTLYSFPDEATLSKERVPQEIDLVVCTEPAGISLGWSKFTHCIVFGRNQNTPMPGLPSTTIMTLDHVCRSEEHSVARDLPPILAAPMQAWLTNFSDPRGTPTISEHWPGSDRSPPIEHLAPGLLTALVPDEPLAVQFVREQTNLGVAWFPSGLSNRVDWVRALVHLWAEDDPDRLPGLRDWESESDWMTKGELEIQASIDKLAVFRKSTIEKLDAEHAGLIAQLSATRDQANRGPRAILTAQGDTLVAACMAVFKDLGFHVEDMDATKGSRAKREDLRLTVSHEPDWEAVVEVKGYGKGGARQNDIGQLNSHVAHYAVEKGRLPNQRIYAVNAEIESALSPSSRRIPFTEEEIQPFISEGGLVLPTPALFKLHRDRERIGVANAQSLLRAARGIFRYAPGV